MKALTTALVVGMLLAAPAQANGDEHHSCATRKLAGSWMFATEVGQLSGLDGGITALGTMNIHQDGQLSGEFDVTVAGIAFSPNITYSGSVTVDRDCRGTLTFETSGGSMRTDSIVVLSTREMWGMSQDTSVLWTYRVRRISRPRDDDDDDD